MRVPLVAGNWKMNKTVEGARELVNGLLPRLQAVQGIEIVLCPPFPSLLAVHTLLKGTGIGLGAQNLHWEPSGAYTGEVSAEMLKELCGYVIIGHSERRAYFGETDETVNKKTKAALANGLIPIVCVGETLAENEAGQTEAVVTRQVMEGLKGIEADQAGKIVIAYEPVWAIGTGKAATGIGANQVIGDYVRRPVASLFGDKVAEGMRILYGGSVNGTNAALFFSQPEIDGALVGGASLKVDDFSAIVQAAAK